MAPHKVWRLSLDKLALQMALKHDPSLLASGFTTKILLEREVQLLAGLDCRLLVFSAHTELARILRDLRAALSAPSTTRAAWSSLRDTAWGLVCDAHCAPICVVATPSAIALACVVLAAQLAEVECVEWLACVRHDGDELLAVMTAVHELHERPELTAEDVAARMRDLGMGSWVPRVSHGFRSPAFGNVA